MPIHDLGYRTWEGEVTSRASRPNVIGLTGFRLAWRSRWLRRLVVFAWIPAVYVGACFFLYELALSNQDWVPTMLWFLSRFGEIPGVQQTLLDGSDISSTRHSIWAWLLLNFFRYPQGFLMLLVVGLIAPQLIAQDVRSKAFLLYFSRPLVRMEYILGKMSVVAYYVILITTLPACALYFAGVLLSPELAVVAYTWDLPLRILVATAVLMIPTTSLALALSSLTDKTFYASFAWFAIWLLGWVAYAFTVVGLPAGGVSSQWHLLSLYHTLGEVQSWVFGLGGTLADVLPAIALLMGVTAVSLIVLFRRVSSPMRI